MELWELFLSAFISSTIAPGGSEAVLAYMASKKSYPISELLTIATFGNTIGAITTWAFGWLAAQKYPLETMLEVNKQKALNMVRAHGAWILLFSWLPVVGDAFCFAAGWLRFNLVWGIVLISLGKFCRYLVIAWIFI